ncbi:uncharacterized protein LOC143869575 [Tasmannia lanceolata]|uniref:uncharacterized protein LOC143852300 n=1 Tax=Tasmannia lanceolata TaxID=3420 RepID=UPI004063A74B
MEGLRGYWKRKKYERLIRPGRPRRKRVELARMGGPNRSRRFWRIRVTPRLRYLRLGYAKKLFVRLRDAYVKMMLGFANSTGFSYGSDFGRSIGYGNGSLKEYDEKMIVQIYKSLVAQGKLMGSEGVKIGGGDIILRQ